LFALQKRVLILYGRLKVLDPLATPTFVGANTKNIALGTSVIGILFHTPVVLAKRFATLDVLSEGRAIAGFGIGWSKDEYQASNIPFSNRGMMADEFIQAIKNIWTDDIVEYKGAFYNIPKSIIGPKPVQKPCIPIYLGGFSPNTLNRIAKYDADGWLGVCAYVISPLFIFHVNIFSGQITTHMSPTPIFRY
jgi:alkanesulfonate monooxygenase SsuD/methylene tetrahydromethanopterin reductase-like flavin-dependent oxidoreductase (luciferase family)